MGGTQKIIQCPKEAKKNRLGWLATKSLAIFSSGQFCEIKMEEIGQFN